MNIGIIGGDQRIVELAKFLKNDGNKMFLYGLDKTENLAEIKCFENMDDVLENADIIITSIPLSKDGKNINTVFSNKNILIQEFFEKAKNKKIITGNITENIKKYIIDKNNNELIDILQYEQLTVLNAVPTAEGAIQVAMEKSSITLHNSKCLVMGFGRIGKILAKMLNGIGAKVYCEARKMQDISWIQSYGYNAIHLNNLNKHLGEFDFIFNTIPNVILDKNNLMLIKKDCLLIDLASKPGGIDFEEAKKEKIQAEWLLALPGKVAPKTAALYIYNTIKSEIL